MTKDLLVLDSPDNLRVYAKHQKEPIKGLMNGAASRIEADRLAITELKRVLLLAQALLPQEFDASNPPPQDQVCVVWGLESLLSMGRAFRTIMLGYIGEDGTWYTSDKSQSIAGVTHFMLIPERKLDD